LRPIEEDEILQPETATYKVKKFGKSINKKKNQESIGSTGRMIPNLINSAISKDGEEFFYKRDIHDN
jgi:hypothetical protein